MHMGVGTAGRRGVLTLFIACLLATGPPAAADEDAAGAGDAGLSDECRAFRQDPDADLGDVLRAGCEPTLAQMSP